MSEGRPCLLQSAMHLFGAGGATHDQDAAASVAWVSPVDIDRRHAVDRAEQAAQSATRLSQSIASLGYPASINESYASLLEGQCADIRSALAEQHGLVRSTLGKSLAKLQVRAVVGSLVVETPK